MLMDLVWHPWQFWTFPRWGTVATLGSHMDYYPPHPQRGLSVSIRFSSLHRSHPLRHAGGWHIVVCIRYPLRSWRKTEGSLHVFHWRKISEGPIYRNVGRSRWPKGLLTHLGAITIGKLFPSDVREKRHEPYYYSSQQELRPRMRTAYPELRS